MKGLRALCVFGLAVVVSQSIVGCADDDAGDDVAFSGSAGAAGSSAGAAGSSAGVAGSSAGAGATGGTLGSEGGSGGAGGSPEGCAPGQERCAGECVTLANDPDHCGRCGNACDADEVCSAGECRLDCVGGTRACDRSCVDTDLDPEHCGDCGEVCDEGLVCSRGRCESSCAAGLTWCDGGDAGPARCVDTLRDRYNCGECGKVCDEGYVCSNGTCALSCQAGLVDCDGVCIDPKKDRDHCGASTGCSGAAAGEVCPAGNVCSNGVCRLTCQEGLVECAGTCVDPSSDSAFCGATAGCGDDGGSAGETCGPGQRCVNGECVLVCPPGQIACGAACIDPLRSREHCGATAGCGEDGEGSAGEVCSAGEICDGGQCVLSCPGSLIVCDGTCVNPKTDRNHCGATEGCGDGAGDAGEVCDWDQICVDGACLKSCAPGLVPCGGDCIDPDTNVDYCGASGDCQGPNAGVACDSGQQCYEGRCLHENCRVQAGVIWCGYDGLAPNRSCGQICERAGMSIADDPSVLQSIDTESECLALANAFGVTLDEVIVTQFDHTCALLSGAMFFCSNDPNCVTKLDDTPGTLVTQFVCPCEW